MSELSLDKAQGAVTAALAYSREHKLRPMAIAVLDARGALKAYAAEDGTASPTPSPTSVSPARSARSRRWATS